MRLRWNILLWIGSLLIVMSVILLLLGKVFFVESFIRIEEQLTRETLDRSINVFEEKISYINRTSEDWAHWDDAYQFMADRRQAFLDSNLVGSALQGLGLNVILFLDDHGGLVAGKAVDLEKEEDVPLYDGLLRELRERSDFWRFNQGNRHYSGILTLPEGPMLMAVSSILTSRLEGPPRGALLMGRFLNEVELAELSQKSNLAFQFSHVDQGRSWPAWGDSPDGRPQVQLRVANKKNLRARILFRDIFGQPAVAVAVSLPRVVSMQGRQATRYYIFWALAASWLSGLIIYLLWDRLLGSREKQQESELLFQHLFQQSTDSFYLCDEGGRFVAVNRQACEGLGYSSGELLALRWNDITEGWVNDLLANPRRSSDRTPAPFEAMFQGKSRDSFPGEVSISRLQSGGRNYFFVLVRDISERKAVETKLQESKARLDFLAYHDTLTGLPNRLQAIEKLQQIMKMGRRSGSMSAILLLDVDRFKNINESLGHETGDEILVEMARRLQEIMREKDFVARFGGDEFLIVLEDMADRGSVETVAEKILAATAQPLFVRGQQFYLTGSIGISLFPKHGRDAQALLGYADTAMHYAKELGRNNFQFFVPALTADVSSRLYLETNLRQALETGQFVLHYQPQFDFVAGRLLGLEALLRWNHPTRGLVAPGEFIPLAEDTGLIVPIGEWVLRQACLQSRRWQEQGIAPVRLAVNISARQFRQAGFVEMVLDALKNSGLGPEWLELEITETALMQSADTSMRMLKALRGAGITLAVDDFGIGYSSLIYLKRFPFSKLKIDQSFVKNLVSNPDDEAIAAAIVALGKTLRLEVVAEGVESEDQMNVLRRIGCRMGQGFLLAVPMDAEETERFLRRPRVVGGQAAG
jgi:diguanylate cyclase (GGDEF)-like protein/PAS domain S-box-containing protein